MQQLHISARKNYLQQSVAPSFVVMIKQSLVKKAEQEKEKKEEGATTGSDDELAEHRCSPVGHREKKEEIPHVSLGSWCASSALVRVAWQRRHRS